MRGGILTVVFLFSLPFLAAVGHDLYLAYGNEDIMAIEEPPKFTDITWMLVTYMPDTYDWIQQSTSEHTRDVLVVPLLRLKTIVAGAIPLATLIIFLCVTKLLGLWPYTDRKLIGRKDKSDFTFKGLTKEGKKVRYKRK